MKPDELYDFLKGTQEARGFYLNQDKAAVLELLDGLLKNKERYGYMSCPCRLAQEDREKDRDIICPCEYRDQDVAEYGSCYCALYVNEAWNSGKVPHRTVPERRPLEKRGF